jgi:hypothetical protein
MTEIEVKNNIFYVLKVMQKDSNKVTLHNDIESPISRIKSHLKSGASPADLDLMKVEVNEENFKIEGIPWSEIAVRLIKET